MYSTYIIGRQQGTVVNNFYSDNKAEVPDSRAQGSVMGPLIFITNGDDVLKLLSSNHTIMMYADTDLLTMTVNLKEKLNSVIRWCGHNNLTVNKDNTKCQYIIDEQVLN